MATRPRGFALVLVPVYFHKTLGLMLYLLHTDTSLMYLMYRAVYFLRVSYLERMHLASIIHLASAERCGAGSNFPVFLRHLSSILLLRFSSNLVAYL